MPILHGFTDRFRGTVAVALQELVARDIDHLIYRLLEASITLWEQDKWKRYNDGEDNCTVQLYRCCNAARRKERRLMLLVPHFQWVNVTTTMLAGTENVKSAKRPDLRIEIGEVGRSFECKRLAPTGGWVRAYVYRGLARFIFGDYGRGEPVGYMVGYVQAGTFAELLAGINQQILGHPGMGMEDQLKQFEENQSSSRSRSFHARKTEQPIQVDHLMIDLSLSFNLSG
jgi:hypothetical protein